MGCPWDSTLSIILLRWNSTDLPYEFGRTSEDQELLQALQDIHDYKSPEHWYSQLNTLAKEQFGESLPELL